MATAIQEGDELNLELYTPHPKQLEAHEDNHRFKILCWGRRTGKSTFAINEVLIKALQDPGRYWIIAPTYRQAKNVYWMDIVFHEVPEAVIKRKNENELYIVLINGSIIELKGADTPDSLRGAGVKGMVLDEYAFQKPDVWDYILRPMLADSKGWAIFISTPNGMNHFYDWYYNTNDIRGEEDYFTSHATSYDNPHLPSEEIDNIKRNTDENEFAQEYMAEFRKMRDLVYRDFSREHHVVEIDPQPNWQCFITADFGFTNPTAILKVYVDGDDNWYVTDEIYEPGMTTDIMASKIKNLIGGRYITNMFADSAAAQTIADLKTHQIYFTPVKKEGSLEGSVKSGITEVANKLKLQELTGKPKLFVDKRCENLIWEFEAYQWPKKQDDRNVREVPVKDNDHALDALRYMVMMVKNPHKADMFKPPAMMKRKRKYVTRIK